MENFTHLGSTISRLLSLNAEQNTRIAKASVTMAKLSKRVWNNSRLTENTKMRIYQACMIRTLLDGNEAWTTYA